MASTEQPNGNSGRILVAVFLFIMAALFALSAAAFTDAPPRLTMFAVAGVMGIAGLVAFIIAAKRRS